MEVIEAMSEDKQNPQAVDNSTSAQIQKGFVGSNPTPRTLFLGLSMCVRKIFPRCEGARSVCGLWSAFVSGCVLGCVWSLLSALFYVVVSDLLCC